MKKIISILTAAFIMCGTLAGCSSEKEAVATDGSTSMEKVIGVLGENFEMAQAYQKARGKWIQKRSWHDMIMVINIESGA